uniref:Uncharacterized protein n=1 Tax=Triticum urartu TaxID=4572 RepID=A0A8R7QMP5_TRIUA
MFTKYSASRTYHTASLVFLPNDLDLAGTSEAAHCYIQKLPECVSFLCDLIWTQFTLETALSL